jgi:urease accessory protein UreF
MFQPEEIQAAREAAGRLVGDPHPLVERLGSSRSVWETGREATEAMPRVEDRASLRAFLRWYREELLLPVEVPAIRRAWRHQMRYEPSELLALDLQLAGERRLRPFAGASRAVGRAQLRRLRPMRDQRLARRYGEAVELGAAHGWHLLVHGLVLGVFSLPLRQGLVHYARQTTAGFIWRAAGPLELRERDCHALFQEATRGLARAVSRHLHPTDRPTILICR